MRNTFVPRVIAILAMVFGMVAGSSLLSIPDNAISNASSQSEGEIRRNAQRVPGQYIVVFKDGVEPASAAYALASTHNGNVGFIYSHAINGFSIAASEAAALAISKNPQVEYVEEDGIVSVNTTQTGAMWGLDRIDQRDLPLSSSYTYNATGSGVRAYIIDTGILRTHQEFGTRASIGFDSVGDGRNGNDCNGHGTHVAGTVGGTTYGVAKSVTIIAVRVLNCQGSGTWSGVIAGIDWVTANHVKPAVANMSLGGGANSSVDTAVRNSVAAGVTYVVAAGNSSANACNYSPAREASALTIGATTSSDAKASYSNFGSCVDLFAPGSGITSAWITSNTSTNTISGTSMASPHVAGAVALYLETDPGATPGEVEQVIEGNATPDKVSGLSTGTPNLLLYTLFDGGTPPPPPPPTGITLSAVGYKVRGLQKADLSWSGATSTSVDIFRNGVRITTTANDGFHTDNINNKGGGTYRYKVCEAGTSTCSSEVTITF